VVDRPPSDQRIGASKADASTDAQLKVFVSYSRRDLAIADAMVAALEKEGFVVSIDRRDLPYGEEWQKELGDFIRASDTVIWLVSPDSVKSSWVAWELGEVGRLNKRLVPVRVADVSPRDLPEAVGKIHLLPATGIYDEQQHLPALVTTLNTDRTWLKDATRLSDRARQWLAKSRDSGLLLRGGALIDAETWAKQHPRGAPLPPSEVLDLIMTSRRGANHRRRWWTGGAIAALAILAQIGLLTLFFRNDSATNDARYSLQNGQVEKAQRQLEALFANPINRVLPASASARALATQLLDAGMVEKLLTLPNAPARRDTSASGELIIAGDRLYGAVLTPTSAAVMRCDHEGRACESAPLGEEWQAIAMVRDGADAFLVGYDPESMKDFVIAPIPRSGLLRLVQQPIAKAKPPQIRNVDDTVIWKGRDYTRNLTSQQDLFLEAPALTADPKLATVAGLVRLDVKADKIKATSSEPQQEDAITLKSIATCSETVQLCVTAQSDMDADARGTITQFDVWRRVDTPVQKAPLPPQPRSPAAANGKSASTSAPPLPSVRFERWIEKLFEPLPSRNQIATSHDGSLIVISENRTLHVWHTNWIAERNRSQLKSLQLAEDVLALQFEKSTGALLVLGPRSLKRVRISPRAVIAEPGIDVPSKAYDRDDDNANDRRQQIGRLDSGTAILRQADGKIVASPGLGRPDRTLHTPPPRSKPEVELWNEQGLVTVYYEHQGETHIIEPERQTAGASPLAGRIAGKVLRFDANGRLAVALQRDCSLRAYASANASVLVNAFAAESTCKLDKESLQIVGKSGSFLVVVHDTVNDQATDNDRQSRFKVFRIKSSGGPLEVRHIFDGTPQQSGGAQWSAERGIVFDPAGSLVVLHPEETRDIERLPLSAGPVLELAKKSHTSGTLEIVELSSTTYMLYLDAADCVPPTGKDGREIAGSFALIARQDNILLPQYLLKCVPRFPDKPSGHNADMVHSEVSGMLFIGAYPFPGLFEWRPAVPSLKLYQFPGIDGDETGTVRAYTPPFTRDGEGRGLQIADLRSLQHLSFWIGATTIEPSHDGQRLLFFRVAEGSAGHSKSVGVLDLSAMTLRHTPNETANFFDNISATWLSPRSGLILTLKGDSNRYELFRYSDLQKIPLPQDIDKAYFSGDEALDITVKSGARLLWRVPEGKDREVEHLRSLITSQR